MDSKSSLEFTGVWGRERVIFLSMTYIATDPHFLFIYTPWPSFCWGTVIYNTIADHFHAPIIPAPASVTHWHIFNETRLWDTSLSLLNANTFQCFRQARKWLFCPLSIHISINVPAYISSLGSFFCQKVPFRTQFQSRLPSEALLPYLLSSLELPSPWFSFPHPPLHWHLHHRTPYIPWPLFLSQRGAPQCLGSNMSRLKSQW